MKLNVPCIVADEMNLCGIASIEMVLRYYKKDISRTEIINYLDEMNGGTDIAQIGRFFLYHSFTAEIVTMHPGLFSLKHIGLSQENLRHYFRERLSNCDVGRKHDKITLEHVSAFMDEGGIMTPNTSLFATVKKELDARRPVIGSLATNFDAEGSSGQNFHFVVIKGHRRHKIFLHNPHCGAFRPRQTILAEWFFSGLYADNHDVIDHGSILLVHARN